MQKGILPSGYQQVVLSASPDLAKRMGKRSDSQPVMLSIHVQASIEQGVLFQQIGELLFVAPSIPTGCFSGPPLPKEKPRAQKQTQPSKAATPKVSGSFAVNLDRVAGLNSSTAKASKKDSVRKGKKERWKKRKRKRERPPWRK
jgi:putative RNA 2'-phosphotransferase